MKIEANTIVHCLDQLAAQLVAEQAQGDTRPVLLLTAANVVVSAHDLLEALDKVRAGSAPLFPEKEIDALLDAFEIKLGAET